MKITDVKAIPFRAPRSQVYRTASGEILQSEYAMVFVETDEGVSGVGEVAAVWDRKGVSQADDVNRILAPVLVGKDPLRLNELAVLMNRTLGKGSNPAKAGVDIPLHDLVGTALGVPVCQLLGGRLRERIPLSAWIGISARYGFPVKDLGLMVEEAEDWVSRGFRTLKVKVGLDHRHDLEAIRQIREQVGPTVTLRADVNGAWAGAKEALRRVQAYEPFDLEFLEQPLPGHDLEGMTFVRERSAIPIMADESVWDSADALAVIRRGAADLINISVMEAGGLRAARHAFAVCEAAGMLAMIGSMPEFGVGTAAQIHLALTVPNLITANDACGFLYHKEDILEAPLAIERGEILAPTGRGLGVAIDMTRFKAWRV